MLSKIAVRHFHHLFSNWPDLHICLDIIMALYAKGESLLDAPPGPVYGTFMAMPKYDMHMWKVHSTKGLQTPKREEGM